MSKSRLPQKAFALGRSNAGPPRRQGSRWRNPHSFPPTTAETRAPRSSERNCASAVRTAARQTGPRTRVRRSAHREPAGGRRNPVLDPQTLGQRRLRWSRRAAARSFGRRPAVSLSEATSGLESVRQEARSPKSSRCVASRACSFKLVCHRSPLNVNSLVNERAVQFEVGEVKLEFGMDGLGSTGAGHSRQWMFPCHTDGFAPGQVSTMVSGKGGIVI